MNSFKIKTIDRGEIESLLREIPSYCENPRIGSTPNSGLGQFRKYLVSNKSCNSEENSRFIGVFEDGKYLALSYVCKVPRRGETGNPGQYSSLDLDFFCIAEIESFRKGYGKILIEYILSKARNVWWMVDPYGGESLMEYYMQFGLRAGIIKNSKWNNGEIQFFFYRAETENDKKIFMEYIGGEEYNG